MSRDGGEAFASEGEAHAEGEPAPTSEGKNCSFLPTHQGTWEAASCSLTSSFALPQRALNVADEPFADAREAPVGITAAGGERPESVPRSCEGEGCSPAQRLPRREDMLKMAHSLGLSQTKASDFAFVAAEAQDERRLKPEDGEPSSLEGFGKLWSAGSEEGQVRSPGQQHLHQEDKLEQQPLQDDHPEAAALEDGGLTAGESLTAEPGELFNFSPETGGLDDAEPAAASSRAPAPPPQNAALQVVDFTPRVDKSPKFWTPPAGSFSILQEPPWGEEGELLTPMEAAQQAAYFASVAEMAAQRVADLEEGEEPPESLLASSWEDDAACPSPFSNSQSGQSFTPAHLLLSSGSRGADRERAPADIEGGVLTSPSGWSAFSGAGGDRMSAIEAARYFSTRAIHTAGLAVAHCMQSFQIGEGASPLLLHSQQAIAQLQQVHPLHQQLQSLAANTAAQQLKSGEDALIKPNHTAARVASQGQAVTALPKTSRDSASSSSGPDTSRKGGGAAQSAGKEQQEQLQQQEVQQRQQQQEASHLEKQRERLQEKHLLLQKLEAEITQQKTQLQQETQHLLQQQQITKRQLEVLAQREEDVSRQREQLEMQREVQSRLQEELQLRELQQRQQDMLQQQQLQQQLQNQHQRQQLQKEELILQMRQQLLEQQLLSHQQVVADFERHASRQLLQRDALQQQLQRQLEDLKGKEERLRHQQKEHTAREHELQQQQVEQQAKERQLQLQQDELQAKDRQLQRQQEEQEAREQDLQRREQQQEDKETELQRLKEDHQGKQKQLQQQQQQLAEEQQQKNQKLKELEKQMQRRDANGTATARVDGSVPLFAFLSEPAAKDEATLQELQHIERQLLALCLAYLNQRKRHLVLLRKPLEAQGQLLRWASSKPAAAAGNAAVAISSTGPSAGDASSIPNEQRDLLGSKLKAWNAAARQASQLLLLSFVLLLLCSCVRLALPLLTKRAEYLGGQELVQGEGPFRLLANSNKLAFGAADWPLSAPQAYSGTPADPTAHDPPGHVCARQEITSGHSGELTASAPPQNSVEPDARPSATFGAATKGSKSCSALTPSAPRQQQPFGAGPTSGAALDVGNAASVTTDEEGSPGRMLSSASEAFRRLPSGFQGDLTLLGFTEKQAVRPAAISSFTAKGKLPPLLHTRSQIPQGSTDATASEWLLRRLQQQPLQRVQQQQLQPQHLSPLLLSKRLGYGSGRAAAGGSAALAVLSGALVGPPGPFDS
ncbi:hypothetical protein Esti_006525 [Eimeria stiedai]